MPKRRKVLAQAGGALLTGVIAGGCLDNEGEEKNGEKDITTQDSEGTVITTRYNGTISNKPDNLRFVLSKYATPYAYRPLKRHLSQEINTTITLEKEQTSLKWVDRFQHDRGEVGETLAVIAVSAHERDEVEIVLNREHKQHGYNYGSALVTRADSSINSVRDLRDGTITIGNDLNLASTIYPLNMIDDAGLDTGRLPRGNGAEADFHPYWVPNPMEYGQEALNLLLNDNRVDAAGVADFLVRTDKAIKNEIRILDSKEGIPSPPVVVRHDLNNGTRDAIMDAFLTAPSEVFEEFWFRAVQKAQTDRYYQSVVKPLADLNISADLVAQDKLPDWVTQRGSETPSSEDRLFPASENGPGLVDIDRRDSNTETLGPMSEITIRSRRTERESNAVASTTIESRPQRSGVARVSYQPNENGR